MRKDCCLALLLEGGGRGLVVLTWKIPLLKDSMMAKFDGSCSVRGCELVILVAVKDGEGAVGVRGF